MRSIIRLSILITCTCCAYAADEVVVNVKSQVCPDVADISSPSRTGIATWFIRNARLMRKDHRSGECTLYDFIVKSDPPDMPMPCFEVGFASEATGFVSAGDGVYQTFDGGIHWVLVPVIADVPAIHRGRWYSTNGLGAMLRADGPKVRWTRCGESSLDFRVVPATMRWRTESVVIAAAFRVVQGSIGQRQLLVRSVDGGCTWTVFYDTRRIAPDESISEIRTIGQTTIVISFGHGTSLWYSADEAKSFKRIDLGLECACIRSFWIGDPVAESSLLPVVLVLWANGCSNVGLFEGKLRVGLSSLERPAMHVKRVSAFSESAANYRQWEFSRIARVPSSE